MTDPSTSATAFASRIMSVEVEVHSFCNRTCWFCPNSRIDRRSLTHYMSDEVYAAILADLQSIRYAGTISYSRYNEPFAEEIFFERLRQASESVPKAFLTTNSNGDFVTRETLEMARRSGLKELRLQSYLAEDEKFDPREIAKRAKSVGRKLDVEFVLTNRSPAQIDYRAASSVGLLVVLRARDFRANGTNRGGVTIRPEIHRTAPCFQSMGAVFVDYNGSIMPCCNLRSDVPEHKEAIIGTIAKAGDLLNSYTSPAMIAWRKRVARAETMPDICRDCCFQV